MICALSGTGVGRHLQKKDEGDFPLGSWPFCSQVQARTILVATGVGLETGHVSNTWVTFVAHSCGKEVSQKEIKESQVLGII